MGASSSSSSQSGLVPRTSIGFRCGRRGVLVDGSFWLFQVNTEKITIFEFYRVVLSSAQSSFCTVFAKGVPLEIEDRVSGEGVEGIVLGSGYDAEVLVSNGIRELMISIIKDSSLSNFIFVNPAISSFSVKFIDSTNYPLNTFVSQNFRILPSLKKYDLTTLAEKAAALETKGENAIAKLQESPLLLKGLQQMVKPYVPDNKGDITKMDNLKRSVATLLKNALDATTDEESMKFLKEAKRRLDLQ
jgi:hypothetical protein